MNGQGEPTFYDYATRVHQLCMDLNSIIISINFSNDVEQVLHGVVEESFKALGCESARIAMREGDNWVITHANKLPDDLIGRSFTDEELPHAALAMATKKPVAIDDAFRDDRTNAEIMKSLGIKSVLVLPLMDRTAVTGAIFFGYSSKSVSFTAAEIDFAEKMTTGVAIALQDDRQYQELEESKRLGDTLNEIDIVLFSANNYGVIINRMLQLATDVIGAETAVIFSKEDDRWAVRYVYKLSESLIGQDFSNTEVMHTAITAETKRSIVVQDVLNSPEIDQKFVEMLGIRSLLDFPLIMNGEVIGDLTFHYHSSAVPFNERQIEFAHKLQISISLALENSRLHGATETAIAASKQAAAVTKAKSQFLANMSHELRTPMTGILGMLQLTLEEDLPPVPRDYLETTQRSAQSLLQILNDILDMSKIEAGKLTIEVKPFSLSGCIAEAVDIISPEVRRKGLDFAISVAKEIPKTVVGDHARLRQILLNLIGNAVKFTDHGKVEVHAFAGRMSSEGKREFTIAVTDTGIGIPDDKKDLLFQSFSQVDASHSRSYGGTGLGLAICRELVELMGGTISFESKAGAGSTFSFTIPLGEDEAEIIAPTVAIAPEPEKISVPEGESSPHLLLAEDDPTIRQMLGVMLAKSNYRLDVAEDGRKAVEMWETGEYDLVLMDIQMPLMNGFEATRAIREKERKRGGHTFIIAMTAHASKDDEKRCLAADMDAFISKPIDFKECLRLIGQTIKQESSVNN